VHFHRILLKDRSCSILFSWINIWLSGYWISRNKSRNMIAFIVLSIRVIKSRERNRLLLWLYLCENQCGMLKSFANFPGSTVFPLRSCIIMQYTDDTYSERIRAKTRPWSAMVLWSYCNRRCSSWEQIRERWREEHFIPDIGNRPSNARASNVGEINRSLAFVRV